MENQNLVQPNQEIPQPQTPPVEEKSKLKFSHIKLIIFGIIAAVIIAGLGGTLVLSKSSVFNPSPTPTLSPSPTIESTAGWKIHKGDGFSFKYPTDGTIEEFPPDAPAPAVILRTPNSSAALLVHIYNSRINFSTVNDAVNYELDSEEKNQIYPSKYIRTSYNNNYINGEKLVSEVNPNTDWNYIHIYSMFKNKIYHLEFRYDDSEDRKKMLLLADKILSTFKFTEPKISCRPRPACFDATPRCLMPETSDMCPPSITPTKSNSSANGKVCTQEAKQCPDGTWVGRTGPNCEFKCP